MWEAAAYSQNVLKVMLDPPTWAFAANAIFWLRGLPLAGRIALALGANLAFTLIFLVWPAGETGRPYAWTALAYELAATAIWLAIFVGLRQLFGRKAQA
jgi:hypothetical protein